MDKTKKKKLREIKEPIQVIKQIPDIGDNTSSFDSADTTAFPVTIDENGDIVTIGYKNHSGVKLKSKAIYHDLKKKETHTSKYYELKKEIEKKFGRGDEE